MTPTKAVRGPLILAACIIIIAVGYFIYTSTEIGSKGQGAQVGGTEGTVSFVRLTEGNATTNSNSIKTANFGGNVTTGNLIVIWMWYNSSSASVTGITDTAGNAYTKIIGPTRGTGTASSWSQELWYAKNVTGGGAFNVTATFSASFNGEKSISAHEYSGADKVNPLDVSSGIAGSSANASTPPVTTTYPNELIFGANFYAMSGTRGTGFTTRSSLKSNITEDRNVTTTGSYAATFVNSAQSWIAQMATFRAVGTTPPPPPPPPSDTTPPAVSITVPLSGATVTGATVAVSATASDNVGVTGVQFKLDGANLDIEDMTSPYSIVWNSGGTSNGSHNISAVGRDAANNIATSSSVTVTTNNVVNKFVIGDRIVTVMDTATRPTPLVTATNLGVHPAGALGTVTGGPVSASGFTWWQIDYDTGADGWSGDEDRFNKYAAGPTFTLTALKAGTGTGTVTSNLGGINCGATCMSTALASGSSVTLTAVPTSGSTFSGWSGGGCSGMGTCTVALSSDTTVTASFAVVTGDTISPSVPTGLSATPVSSSQIDLTWNVSTDNVGVTGYRVYRGGVQAGTPATNSYSSTGLAPSTAYTYNVSAVDAAGNASAQSASVSATTPAGTPPPPPPPVSGGDSPLAGPIVGSGRTVDWSQAGVPGGIPNRTSICATLGSAGGTRSTVQNVTTDQINAAIASCPANQVVFLNPGTYNLGSAGTTRGNNNGITVTNSNVTLRGSGPDKTYIHFTNGIEDNRVQIGNFRSNSSLPTITAVNWTGGYAKGTTQLTLASPIPASQVGGIICMDQLYDGTYVRQQGPSGSSPSWLSRNGNRLLQQCSIATAVSGNSVTIAPALASPYWNIVPNLSPQVWWFPKSSQIFYSGVEDFTIDAAGSSGENSFEMSGTYGSWLKNVAIQNIPRRAIIVRYSLNAEVRDNFIRHGASYCTDGGAIEIGRGAVSYTLFENNIITDVAAVLYNESETGNVIGYNYAVNFPYCYVGWLGETLNTHGAHPNMTLFEGNQTSQFVADDVYDPTSHITLFRNRFSGTDVDSKDGQKTGGTYAMSFVRWSDHFAAVGNILGTTGIQNKYDDKLTGSGGGGGIYNYTYFTGYPTGFLRGGNYDVVTGNIIWNNNKPAGDTSTYLASQALPPSFYRTSKPVWWNSSLLPNPNLPWPAIGPDVTGGNVPGVGGHAYDIPAKQCFEKLNLGAGGLYNGKSCYGN